MRQSARLGTMRPMHGSERAVRSSAGESEVVRRLDELVAVARAHCGLVVVRTPAGLCELAARSDRRRDLSPPVGYSRSVCERVFADGRNVVLIDVGGVASRRSVVVDGSFLQSLVLIECSPVNRGGETVAVVYLEANADDPPPGESPSVRVALRALADAAFPVQRP